MAKGEEFFSPELAERLTQAEPVDLVIGVLTINNAATVESLVKGVVAGLREHFEGQRALLINCDAGSHDDTPHMVERAAAGGPPAWTVRLTPSTVYSKVFTESGMPGRDRAFRTVFAVAQCLGARACLIVDGDLRSLSPQWIAWLEEPVMAGGVDLVVPLYHRHRYDGTLTNQLMYPLSRALYGKRVRFPSGGIYGLSAELVRRVLGNSSWEMDTARYGVDGWLTTTAIAEGLQVCHACLGPKEREGKPVTLELSTLLAQEVGCTFHLMERYQGVWESVRSSVEVAHVGLTQVQANEMLPVHVDRMVRGFRQGLRDLLPVWEILLGPETLGRILSLGIEDVETFRFPTDLWVQVVYDFALAYHDKVLHREHLLKSLTPLYLGRTASFIMETRQGAPEDVERSIELLCRQFEEMKPYLTQRWRWQNE